MISIRNVFLTPKVCSFDSGEGDHTPSPRPLQLDRTINQDENRDFDVFYKKWFFDPADRQASKQVDNFFQDSSLRERELTLDSNSSTPITLRSTLMKKVTERCFFLPCGHTSNQTNNLFFQDSSVREREY